jgi:hypothetical protein
MPEPKESPIRIIKTAIGLANFGNVDIGGDLFKLLDSIDTDLAEINSQADDDEFIEWSQTTQDLMTNLEDTIIDELRQKEGEIDETDEDNNEGEEIEAREEEDEEDNDDDEEEENEKDRDAIDDDVEDDEDETGRDFEDDDEDDIPPGESPIVVP